MVMEGRERDSSHDVELFTTKNLDRLQSYHQEAKAKVAVLLQLIELYTLDF